MCASQKIFLPLCGIRNHRCSLPPSPYSRRYSNAHLELLVISILPNTAVILTFRFFFHRSTLASWKLSSRPLLLRVIIAPNCTVRVIRSSVHLTAIVNSTENLHIEIDKKVLLLKYDDSESKKSRCRRLFRLAERGHRSSEPFSSAALLPAIEDVVDSSIQ